MTSRLCVEIAADSSRSLDEPPAIGRRDNHSQTEEDPKPWAQARQSVNPAVPTWLHSSHEVNRWRKIAQQIQCPALLVAGDPSVDTNRDRRTRSCRASPAAVAVLTVADIPAAGHSIHSDQCAPFQTAVTGYLSRLDRPMPTATED